MSMPMRQKRSTIYAMQPLRWTIGEVEVIQVVEMIDNELFPTFIPEATPEHVLAIDWMKPHFVGEKGNLNAQVQSFLIRSGKHLVLIDTCNGNDKSRPNVPTWGNLKINFLDRLEACGVRASDITVVTCTHLHFDHVGWNTKRENGAWVPTFPNARYLFSKQEYEYWIKRPEKEMIDDLNGIDDSVTPIVGAGLAEFIADDCRIDEHVYCMPTPGHTPHHISIGIESKGKKAVITGDVLHHPCQVAHPEWTTLADTYPDQTVETRKKFLSSVTNTDTLVIGSHFANPVAGYVVKRHNTASFRTDILAQ
jgi:glyoxylase-like metal-dependent hydrolase (beta-lactamase superfamily II)